ncbi:hypothetical protein [Piscinibacter sp.]|uniref:hypothetical protein n=1 Tax=Piscinibacter sp. TaxID=1903157 RepID=UPI0039E37E4D
MSLDQFQQLRHWHLCHRRDHPMEGHIWTAVVTLWMVGWVGAPAAWLVHEDGAAAAVALFVFVPGLYVACRIRLHRRGRLRCDWINALKT